MAQSSRERFIDLMKREILKLDLADLDFGIYRVLRFRRAHTERFFDEDLPALLDDAMSKEGTARRAELEQRAAGLSADLDRTAAGLGLAGAFEGDALRPQLAGTPKGAEYEEARQALDRLAEEPVFAESEEDRLYNVLYTFFSRYYRDGDFQPQQRRAREARYSVPYSGEDVHFHWRSRGSHYVKTTEELKSYSFRSGAWRVRFELVEAYQEPDNVKGTTRFFIPVPGDCRTEPAGEGGLFVVPFAYRKLTPAEARDYGSKSEDLEGDSVQERLINDFASDIQPPKGITKEALLRHLLRYARKNRTDYFVHPQLGQFLRGELDYFLKNEFLDIEGLTSVEAMADRLRKLRVLRTVSERIIAMLAEIESFQARLFEKRKFVLSCSYLVPIRLVPDALWEEVRSNADQIAQWRRDFTLTGRVTRATLIGRPTLVVDTGLFPGAFQERLLASVDDVDAVTDSVLVRGENFGALRTLGPSLAGHASILYTDPPYNTGQDGFLYKDNFARHSAWLSMLIERVRLCQGLLSDDGVIAIHIDENEAERLRLALDQLLGEESFLGSVVWDKRNPKGDSRGVAVQHETILMYARSWPAFLRAGLSLRRAKPNAAAILEMASRLWNQKKPGEPRTAIERAFSDWLGVQPFSGGERAYSQLDDEGRVFQSVSMGWPNRTRPPAQYFRPLTHPITGKECALPERGWRNPPETMDELLARGLVLFGPDHTTIPRRKYLLSENLEENLPSVIYHGGSDAAQLAHLGLSFDDPSLKPLAVVGQIINCARGCTAVVDPFAGSGTTAHAVIVANRADGLHRRAILVEMGDYFESVLTRRVAKVMYAPEWSDGAPAREPNFAAGEWPQWVGRSPRLVQVLRLESYEDSLDSLTAGNGSELDSELRVRYVLADSLEDSACMLSTQKLEHPFDYQLEVHTDDGVNFVNVDLVTTFNLIAGIRLKRYRELEDRGRRYVVVEGTQNGTPVLVIWRDVKDLDAAAERAFLTTAIPDALGKTLEEYERIWHNADSALPKGESLDAEFKRLMFEPEPVLA